MTRNPLSAGAGRVLSGTARWLRAAAARLDRQLEWDGLSDEDRRQVSADVGISDAEMTAAMRTGNDSEELLALLSRPALRHTSYPLEVLRDMQRVCTFCPHHRRCREWQAKAASLARWPAFCPNAYTFASLRRSAASETTTAGRWP
ncbi:MAG TPA: DUF6455 family protein [Ferrovibrio sp.]|jgi:hypothetical protein|uniref:DUF6455 family protein n=1 Tax=Ferrovibrio sp. TaxID=1917215 RepID=UPI002B4ABE17|nr:DUF6455 family protein [Ferrovibrio sp.]HLT79094.1 DUF6455 family protein [Ferrovibrio sp.]